MSTLPATLIGELIDASVDTARTLTSRVFDCAREFAAHVAKAED